MLNIRTAIYLIIIMLALPLAAQNSPGSKKIEPKTPKPALTPSGKTGQPTGLPGNTPSTTPKKTPATGTPTTGEKKTGEPGKDDLEPDTTDNPDGTEEEKKPEGPPPPISSCSKRFSGKLKSNGLNVSGRWEFYKDRSRGSSYKRMKSRSGWKKVKFPSRFKDSGLTRGYKGHAWYRCGIISSAEVKTQLALYLGEVHGTDEVYFNGALIGRTGSFKPLEADIRKKRLYSIPGKLWKKPGFENMIMIHLYGSRDQSGFHEKSKLVEEGGTARAMIIKDLASIVISWTYILVSGFFLLFFVFFPHQKENLFFALFSVGLGLFQLLQTEMRYEMGLGFIFSYKIELLLIIALPALYVAFIVNLIKIKFPKVVWGLIAFSGILFIMGLVASKPSHWENVRTINYVNILGAIGLSLWLFIKHYKENKAQMRFISWSWFFIIPAIINDILVMAEFHPIPDMPRVVVYAFLVFLGTMALQLSDSTLRLYRDLQDQEKDLRVLEKKKTGSIFNISTEFRLIFEGFREGLDKTAKNIELGKKPGKAAGERIRKSVINLQNFLSDSNLLPMLESGEYVPRRVRFSLNRLFEDVLDRALAATGENKKRILSHLPGDTVEITGDPDLISAAIYHMLENALLYTKGKVEVSADREAHDLIVMVRDEGPGMDEVQQIQAFQKFVRGVEEFSSVPGIGIGLTIIGLIAMYLEGDFRLESSTGYFSTFVFTVPLNAEQRTAS